MSKILIGDEITSTLDALSASGVNAGQFVGSKESLLTVDVSDLVTTGIENIAGSIVASNEGADIETVKEGIAEAIAVAHNPKGAQQLFSDVDYTSGITAASFGGSIVAANEEFDNIDLTRMVEVNVSVNAAVYNAYGFTKALYQPQLLKGAETGLNEKIVLPVTYNRVTLEGTTTVEDVQEASIFDALRNGQTIAKDKFRLLPDANNADNGDVLVTDASFVVDGVKTAPIKNGVNIDIITVSKETNSLVNGKFTTESTVGPGASIEHIVLQAKNADDSVTEYIAIDVANDPTSNFLPTRNGDSKDLFISTVVDYNMIKFGATKKIANGKLDGAPSEVLAGSADIPAGTVARIAIDYKADLNTRTRVFAPRGVGIILKQVIDASGAVVDADAALYAKVKAVVDKMSIAGFFPKAFHRDRTHNITSVVIDTVTKNDAVLVSPRDGVATIIPTDGQFTKAQIGIQNGAIKQRIESESIEVTKLYHARIKNDIEKGVPLTQIKTAGLGKFVLNAQVTEVEVDLSGSVDAVEEGGKVQNAGALLANKIGLEIASMITNSRIKVTTQFLDGVNMSDVTLTIATTEKVANLLRGKESILKDLTGLGQVKIEATVLEDELKEGGNDIGFVTLTVPGKPNHLLNFGRLLYKTFVTGVVSRAANGSVKELYTKPFYLHQPKLPFLLKLVVKNIDSLSNKRVFNTKDV